MAARITATITSDLGRGLPKTSRRKQRSRAQNTSCVCCAFFCVLHVCFVCFVNLAMCGCVLDLNASMPHSKHSLFTATPPLGDRFCCKWNVHQPQQPTRRPLLFQRQPLLPTRCQTLSTLHPWCLLPVSMAPRRRRAKRSGWGEPCLSPQRRCAGALVQAMREGKGQ